MQSNRSIVVRVVAHSLSKGVYSDGINFRITLSSNKLARF
jgi:hypothetical protein